LTSEKGEALDLGYVGEVIEVNNRAFVRCISQGVTPVISPTARGEDGRI